MECECHGQKARDEGIADMNLKQFQTPPGLEDDWMIDLDEKDWVRLMDKKMDALGKYLPVLPNRFAIEE